jgi:hypothetical protein
VHLAFRLTNRFPLCRVQFIYMPIRTVIVAVVLSLSSLGLSGFLSWPSFSEQNVGTSEPLPPVATPILAGQTIPEIEVLDWIQGEPVDFHYFGSKLTVIDVWSDW